MSRYIDADELIPLIRMGEMNAYTEFGEGRNSGIAYAIERIKQMPTVDVVEVVRCESCEWAYDLSKSNPDVTGVYSCSRHGEDFFGFEYCNKGQRREE